jgi:hypothetical protein
VDVPRRTSTEHTNHQRRMDQREEAREVLHHAGTAMRPARQATSQLIAQQQEAEALQAAVLASLQP